MGKPSGQDANRGKAGYVALVGVVEARHAARRMIDDANEALEPWPNTAQYMQNLAKFAIARNS